MTPKVGYIIELWDDHDHHEYRGWSDKVLVFECEPEAEARVNWIFQHDTSVIGARIIRVEKTESKKLRSPKHPL